MGMNLKITMLIGLSFLLIGISSSQNLNTIWYFGDGNFIDFNNSPSTISGAGIQMATSTSTYCIEGTSSITDASGQLLFYSDGRTVWDKNYNAMPNGNGLFGHSSNAQVLIIPKPGSTTIYFVFYADYAGGANGFSYSEIDMSLNGGLGDVTQTKNIQLHSPSAEMVKGITHCNGTDIWVLSHDATGNTFRAYLVTASGVSTTPVISSTGTPFSSVFTGMSLMTCRKDGKKIAINADMNVEIFDFDNQNGTLCDPITVPNGDIAPGYGIEFSEDGTKLYVGSFNLHQFDLSSNNASVIAASNLAYSITEAGGIMRGPDDKIYVAGGCDYYDTQTSTMYYSRKVHVIQNPNLAGIAASNLVLNVFTTPRECGLGFANCYYPTQTTNTCGPALQANASISSSSICFGDCVNYANLSTGPAISYNWIFSGGNPSVYSGLTPPQICYPNAGNYTSTLLITDCSGNTSTVNLNVTVNNCTNPAASFIPQQNQICQGDCISFTDNSTGSNINSWNWSFNGGNPAVSSVQNPGMICFSNTGVFPVTLTITDDFGTDDTTILITVNACLPPVAGFSASDLSICQNECIDFTDLSLYADTWNWTFSGGNPASSAQQNPVVCFDQAGNYQVTLTVTNAYGSSTETVNVEVFSLPDIDLGDDITIDFGESVTVNAIAGQGQLLWYPTSEFDCSNCSSQQWKPEETITVIVVNTDNNQCSSSDTMEITVNSLDEIFIPNAFSPNEDGLNDYFFAVSASSVSEFTCMIFDRWGELVFSSENILQSWDGTYGGQKVANDVYVWRITGRIENSGTYFDKTGHVSVVR
jgi:gliding motility-associated-like protein